VTCNAVSPNGWMTKVVAISPPKPVSQEIADRAFQIWLSRCFRLNGSPEQALLSALLEVTFQESRRSGLFAIGSPQRTDRSVIGIDTRRRIESGVGS